MTGEEDKPRLPTIDDRQGPVRVQPEPSDEPAPERYSQLEILGRGGMGEVFAAHDARLGRIVAVKRMLTHRAKDAGALRRFLIEAQVSAQLEHPHIIPVYEIREDGETPSFTMRLLDQRTLADHLAECRDPERREDLEHSLAARLQLFLRLAEAMSYAHSRGVIHRDLKPDNVVLGLHGELYVVDWGIAKIVGVEEEAPVDLSGRASDLSGSAETQLGAVIGTPTYMPPEQAHGEVDDHGPASDQFALGMLLQHLATLKEPRTGRPLDQVVAAGEGKREPMHEDAFGDPVPPELRAIVDRATRPEPEDRYPDVDAMSDDVERYLRGLPVSVYDEGIGRRVWRTLSRRPTLSLGVGLGLIVLALTAAVVALTSTVSLQERASRESARLRDLSALVVGHSESIDARFARAAELTEGIAMAAMGHHHAGVPVEGPLPFAAEARLEDDPGPAFGDDLEQVEGYDMRVSFERPMYHWPARVEAEGREPPIRHMRVLAPLAVELRNAYLRSHNEEALAWPPSRQATAMRGGEIPLWAIYVAFEDGLLLNFPGWRELGPDYDSRNRPWYRGVRSHTGIHFGLPYVERTGRSIILPCNRALRDIEGRFIGVAGADYTVDDLAELMRVPAPGWRRSELVDPDAGHTIVSTDQQGLRLTQETQGENDALRGEPIDEELHSAIEASGTSWLVQGDTLTVFDPLEEPGWTFVAYFDRDEAFARPDTE